MRQVKFLLFLTAALVTAGCSKNDDIENTVSEQATAVETVTEQEETAEMVSSAVLEGTTEIESSTALEETTEIEPGTEQEETTEIETSTVQEETETTKTAAVQTEPENSSVALQNTPLPISAGAYCLMDADTGEVLLANQADEQLAPASITKVVTALVVAEHCPNLDEEVLVTEEMFADVDLLSSTITPQLRAGEIITIRDLLYGMALPSGNECASALAIAAAGSVETFAEWMNETAEEAEAAGCHFTNASGLDREGHVVTALGMCRLWRAALQNAVVRQVFGNVAWTIPSSNLVEERHLTSTNQYLNGAVSLDGVYAGKSGWTSEAGATLVTAVQRENQNLLVVVLGSERGKNYADTNYILDYYAGASSPSSVCSASTIEMDSDGFTVSATVSDSICQSKIAYWTNEYGQDDIVWLDVPVKDGVISAHVSCAPGLYTVSLLGYDADLNVLAQDDLTVLMCGYQMKPGLNDWNGARWAILENGACQLGWYEDGQWACYGDESGLMQEGFLDLGTTKYYLKDYQVQRGWLTVDGKTYYGLASGELVTGQVVIDGEMRCFDEDGTLVE
jgi:D-alanyl-D-alanine carboxypeptidase